MSVTQGAEATASRAANSKVLEVLTRAGFIGYGVVHLLFAWLALQLAFGGTTTQGDQSGALRELAAQPLGRVLVIAVAVGMLAMAIWQALEALVGHRVERGRERVFERLASVGRTLVYAYFAWLAYQMSKQATTSSADKQQDLTQDLMGSTGGRWLVALAGLAIAVLGAGLVWYGLTKRFEKHLHTLRMSPGFRRTSRRLGMGGYTAKGVAYGIAGVLVVAAAATHDPNKARGLDAALRTLRDQSYGQVLLTLIAVGIAAFGVFCFVQARYRKV
jgi:NADH:ubiquinone oxidoreductase subunit 6 (subunit J)